MSGDRVLIVDDEPNLLRLVEYALQQEGYETLVATTGVEAIAAVEQHDPDLLILDVMMPDMTGLEVCQRIRANPATENMPIIILSARGQVSDKIEGLEAGADEYLAKPVLPEEMVARVTALLQRTRRLQRDHQTEKGRVVGIIGAKGGVGTTTLALNLAATFAEQGDGVIVCELRDHVGTAARQLGQIPDASFAELTTLQPLDVGSKEVAGKLMAHPAGFNVLYAPQPGEVVEELSAELAEAVVDRLASLGSHVFLDLPYPLTAATCAALGSCDDIVLVVEREPGAVWSAAAHLDSMRSLGVPRSRVSAVLVNRARLGVSTNMEEVRAHLECDLLGLIPAGEGFMFAYAKGLPLVSAQPDDPAAGAVRDIAAALNARRGTPVSV